MTQLFIALFFSIGINLIMFVPAYVFKTDKLTDISYATTFVLIALANLVASDGQVFKLVLFALILAWAVRLGGFLLLRIQKIGKDDRFNNLRENFVKFLLFWLLQAVTVWIILIPAVLAFSSSHNNLTVVSIIGGIIFTVGLLIETFADKQKSDFKSNPLNAGKWVNTGLWKYSRHPNYLGEIIIWLGVYIYTFSALTFDLRILGLISPVFIFIMLRFISGVPILEKSANIKWGKDADYLNYKSKTGLLLPKYVFRNTTINS